MRKCSPEMPGWGMSSAGFILFLGNANMGWEFGEDLRGKRSAWTNFSARTKIGKGQTSLLADLPGKAAPASDGG